MRAGAAAAKAAKVGIAFVVSPAAGLREAGVALVDMLVKSDPEMKVALDQVTAELTGLARARGYSYDQSRTAFRSMQDLLEFHKLSVDELAELAFDPVRATNAQLAKGAPLMRTLSQDESDLTEQAVLSLYRAVLSNPKLLPGRDEAFQRRVLAEKERLALPAQARAQPVEQLRARGLEPAVGVPLSSHGSPAKAIQARAGSGVFDFVDRGRILETLCDWVGVEDPFAVVVVGGRGGSGKTRLAVELCLKAQDSGWLTGLLQLEPPADALPALADAEAMRLIVIDYAETRIAQLVSLLPLLWARATRLHPVRVVLLVRTRPAGARDWRSPLTATGDANLGNLLDDADVFEIETTELADRVEVYDQAFAGFMSRKLDRDARPPQPAPGPVPTPDLSAPVFDNPLMVVIAAYLAVHHDSTSATPPPRSRPELLDELLAHEARFWDRQWAEADLLAGDATLQARVVALATLSGARDEDDAATLLTLLPDLATEPSGRIRAIARWAHHLYADIGSLWWNPLQPDVMGEHLVATRIAAIPSVIAGVLDRDDPSTLTHALDLLARAAADHSDLKAILGPLLAGQLQPLCRLAAEQAAQVRGGWHTSAVTTLAGALTRALLIAPIGDQTVLRGASERLPSRNDLVLGILSLVLYDQLVASYRQLSTAHEPDLARSLTNRSNRLAEAGRRPEALAAIEEAVTTYRQLAAANPAAYEPDLARSLTNLSIRLAEAGRRPEALAAIEEAVTTYRQLAAANPAAFRDSLASSLQVLEWLLHGDGEEQGAPQAE